MVRDFNFHIDVTCVMLPLNFLIKPSPLILSNTYLAVLWTLFLNMGKILNLSVNMNIYLFQI